MGSETVIESVEVDVDEAATTVAFLARVRPPASDQRRCQECHRACPRHDRGGGQRGWRALDLGPVQAFVVADAPRIDCRRHSVKVAWVPWARHAS